MLKFGYSLVFRMFFTSIIKFRYIFNNVKITKGNNGLRPTEEIESYLQISDDEVFYETRRI